MNVSDFGKNTEKITGLPIDQIRIISPERFRSYLEQKNHKTVSFASVFPIIGRGNVLRDDLVTSETLNAEIDRILR